MTRASRRLAAVLCAASLCAAGTARSQNDKAAAESLFRAGRALAAEGKFDEACPKFVESQRLDPSPGTQLNLARCYEGQGKTASAWAEYKAAAASARTAGRSSQETTATELAAVLEPKLSTLTITAPPAPIEGLEVKRDGEAVGAGSLGVAIAVDPGPHRVEARAPGRSPWSTSVDVGKDRDRARIAIPDLAADAAPAPTASARAAAPPPPEGGGLRTAGYVVGAIGVAAVGVGAVFGILALGDKSDADAICKDFVCNDEGYDKVDAASTKALVSTIGIGVGTAAIGAAVVMIVVGGPRERAAARLPVAPHASAGSYGATWTSAF